MEHLLNKKLFLVFIFAFLFLFGVKFYPVFAGSEHNLSGWAWSENIGWISFNSINQGTGANYGVKVASNGRLSGYAWSENIGWITFNQNELGGCPNTPCRADFDKTGGNVTGWARALANGGGWDGWISLSGSNYGVTVDQCGWQGWAWGSNVIGWISFSGANYGVLGTGDACSLINFSFSALPSSGYAPLSTILTASLTGGIGTINYTFWWNCSDTRTSVQAVTAACGDPTNPAIGAKFNGVSETTKQVNHTYSSVSSYTAKVITEQGSRSFEGRQTISAQQAPEDFSLQKSNDISAAITASPLAISSRAKITVNPLYGFSSPVILSSNAGSVISGASDHFSDPTLTSGEYANGSDFWIDMPRTTTLGEYIIVVSGYDGENTRTVNIILNVRAITPEFREI
jgi:hypothetical protein